MDKKIITILRWKVLRNCLYEIWTNKHIVSITFFKTLLSRHPSHMIVAVDWDVKHQTKSIPSSENSRCR